jgi:hypothetical protein
VNHIQQLELHRPPYIKIKVTKSKSTQNLGPDVLAVYCQFTIAVALKIPQKNWKQLVF